MQYPGNNFTTPPGSGEIEISIFGPGFGECLVIHLGLGEWAVVDSCLEPKSKRPAALAYLNQIDQDPANSVKLVVITHWHDDHIQGAASLFRETKRAAIACTPAINDKEIKSIVHAWKSGSSLPFGSGVDELTQILTELAERGSDSFPSPMLAWEGRTLWSRSAIRPSGVIKSMSPSDATILATQTSSGLRGIPSPGSPRLRVSMPTSNARSVVLSLSLGNCRALLGADLEVDVHENRGWLPVVGALRKELPHEIFKIPHHGSQNGHEPQVWEKILLPKPIAFTSPILTGGTRLPTKADCARILTQTDKAFLSAPPNPRKFKHPENTVDKTIAEVATNAFLMPGRFGIVRMRKQAESTGDWTVELFGEALQINETLIQGAQDW